MHSIIPESFAPILPPKPEVLPLPATDETDLEGFWARKALDLEGSCMEGFSGQISNESC